MSIISQFPCKPLISLSSQNPQFNPKSPLLLTANSLTPSSSHNLGWMPGNSITLSTRAKREIQARAAEEEAERSPETGGSNSGAVAVAEAPAAELDAVAAKIKELKKKLVDAFYGTERGLKASSETRAEIVELINQLEALNPTPAPTEALSLLNGKWILVYTSFSGLFPLLSSGRVPLVKVEEISQTIDSENFTVQNCVKFAGPLATTSVSTNAKFEVRSPKRVQIKFVEGIIGTPQITDSIEIPENVDFLGQKIDLTPFKGLLNSVQDTASSVARTISNRPPLKFNLSENAESWLLTTYLDEELRISRGDAGSVFVFIKEGSPLLSEAAP